MKLLKVILHFILFNLYHVKIKGYQNVPTDRAVLLASNHTSALDGLFLWCQVENIAIMVKKEVFDFKPLVWLFKRGGLFPIARGEKDFKSLYHAINILKDEKNKRLLIFPEGTRNAAKKNIKAKTGAVYLAKATKTELLPIYISERKNSIFRKTTITFGKPYYMESIEDNNNKDKEILRKETDILMDKIYGLKETK